MISYFLPIEIGNFGLEAGIKYLVLAAASAAFLLFGMALIYGALGAMQFAEIVVRLARASSPMIFAAGLPLRGRCLLSSR